MNTRNISHMSGFTLVEMLVVIAILSILAAIVFPIIGQAKEQAKSTACMSNNRQLGTSTQMYLQDFDERFPFMVYSVVGTQTQFNTVNCGAGGACQLRWADMIQSYVQNLSIFSCPSDTARFRWTSPKRARLSYGLNGYMFRFHGGKLSSSDRGPGPAIAEIARPAERVMLSEISNGNDAVTLWCYRSPQLSHDRTHDACKDKHGRVNVVYFDGHAKIFKLRGLLDQQPYISKRADCSQNAPCIEKYYPEWAPWVP